VFSSTTSAQRLVRFRLYFAHFGVLNIDNVVAASVPNCYQVIIVACIGLRRQLKPSVEPNTDLCDEMETI